MKSACESLKVFDFNEEDELSETTSARVISKFKNPNAIDKYKFLENFAGGTKIQSEEIGNVPCVDVDAAESDRNCDVNAFSYTPLDPVVDSATKGTSGSDGVPQCSSTSHEHDPQCILNTLKPGSLETRSSSLGVASSEESRLNCAKSPSNDEPVDVVQDAGERMYDKSPSTSSDIVDDSASVDDPSSDHCLGDWDMGNSIKEIPVCPDYIEYDDKHCTECVLIFSSSSISMKGSTDQGTFSFQRGLEDIVDIESLWFGRLEMAIVKIRTISKDGVQAGDVHGASGIEELKFAVVDSNWYEKQEVITSLDVRYSTLWNVVFDADIGRNEEALVTQSGACFSKRYFPNFGESFEEVVYPKGDADAVSISKRDVDLLQPETFVNDTIIDFYIKHLKNKIQPEERRRFHFFNSFFFRKLADLDKDPSSACQGRAAFQRVRKWTRKVNLFEKDYVFIPVNFNYHWSLIVICHPGEVAKFRDEDVAKSLKVPCILHMDSIRGSHTGLKDLVQSYLWEEWKEKQKQTSEDISSKFSNLRFVPLELPQQQNSYDCGLFLLHYVELFLEETPVYFSPFKITKFSNFLSVDWFPPTEASLKRVLIQRLIYELLENHSQENSPTINGGKHFHSNCPESFNRNETGVEFLSDRCIPKSHDANLLCSQGGQGIEINLLPTSSQRSSQCVSDSGLVLRDLFEPEVTAGSFLDGQCQAFDRVASFNEFKSAMSAMEVDIEADGHFGYPSTADTGFNAITSEACAFSYPPRDLGAETSWNQEISLHQTGHKDNDSSPETSLSDSDKTPIQEDLGVKVKLDQERSQSPENRDCSTESFASASETLSGPESQDPDHNGDADPRESCEIVLPGLARDDCDMQEKQLIGDDSVSEADDRAAKRLRIMSNLEGDTKLTSLSKDLHL